MTLDDMLLPKLAEWRPAAGRTKLTVSDERAGWAITLTADRCDELGCLLWELNLRRSREAPPGATLQGWAEGAASSVTGLLEPLRVLEVDAARGEALLRSDEPTWRKEKLAYYEILLKGTQEAAVRRYQADEAGGKREQVAFALTHEALAKLAADLTAER